MPDITIVGHRGARNEAPENTVEGFKHAADNGCEHFELDIQLSFDKELVVYHDSSLKRTSGVNKKLSALPYSILSNSDSRINTPGWPTPCFISNLDNIINAVPATKSWQFEVKTTRRHSLKVISEKLIELIEAHNLFEKCHVTSTNKWFLRTIKARHPKIKIGFVCEYLYQRPVKTCSRIDADLLVLNEKLATHYIIKKAKRKGINISCWTVNDKKRIDQLIELGIYNIITDLPSEMIKHFKPV